MDLKLGDYADIAQIVGEAIVVVGLVYGGLRLWLRRRHRGRHKSEAEELASAPTEPPPLTGLAARPAVNTEDFRARELDLARLNQLAGDGKCVIWVTGPTQAGKTWLVSQWVADNGYAERFARFELEAGATLPGLLEGINSFLCRGGEHGFDPACRAPAATTDQQVAELVRVLNERRWVILLDSFETVSGEAEMKSFLARLQQDLRASLVMVGTQVMPEWGDAGAEVPLREIGEEAGLEMLAEQDIAVQHRKALYEKVGGLPGALVKIAVLVRNRGLAGATSELAGTAAEVGEKLLRETFDALSEGGQRLWAGICLLPARITRAAAREFCAREDFDASWDELARWKLLQMTEDKAELHPLARSAGEKRLGEMKPWARACGERIARYYAQFAQKKHGDRAAIEAELENVLAAARLAFHYREWEALWAMGDALDDPLDFAGRWTVREELLRLCYEGAVAAKDSRARAAFSQNLGVALQQRGKLEEAEGFYNQSLAIEREVGNRVGIAQSLHQLGTVAQLRGKVEEAEDLYKQSLAIKREVGDRPGEAKTLHQLGRVAELRGKLEEAEGYYNQSLEIEREVGDRPGEAKTLHQLGVVAQRRGKLEEAEGFYNQSLVIAREVGDRPGEAKTLHQLGRVAQDRGKLGEAEVLYQQSLAIKREVGDRPGEARTLAQMSLLAEVQGNLKLAVERMEKACAMMEEMGLAEKEQARAELERLRKGA